MMIGTQASRGSSPTEYLNAPGEAVHPFVWPGRACHLPRLLSYLVERSIEMAFKLKRMGKATFAEIMSETYKLVVCPNEDGCGGPAIVLPEGDGQPSSVLCLGCWYQFNPETGEQLNDEPADETGDEDPAAKGRK